MARADVTLPYTRPNGALVRLYIYHQKVIEENFILGGRQRSLVCN